MPDTVARKALLEPARDVLTREASFLDEQRWDEWLALFTEDCEFWVPTWLNEENLADDPESQLSHVYYANRAGLEDRIARIRTGKSAASTPLRRTTHMVGNVMLLEAESDREVTLRSSWTSHVHDPSSKKTYVLFGHARYQLRLSVGSWLIARKKTVLQNDYLPSMVDVYCI